MMAWDQSEPTRYSQRSEAAAIRNGEFSDDKEIQLGREPANPLPGSTTAVLLDMRPASMGKRQER